VEYREFPGKGDRMKKVQISQVVALLAIVGLVLLACGPTAVPTQPPTGVPTTEEPAAEGAPYKIGFAPGVTGGGSFLGEPERNVASWANLSATSPRSSPPSWKRQEASRGPMGCSIPSIFSSAIPRPTPTSQLASPAGTSRKMK